VEILDAAVAQNQQRAELGGHNTVFLAEFGGHNTVFLAEFGGHNTVFLSQYLLKYPKSVLCPRNSPEALKA
jgi:hypothetical protein